LGSFCLVTQRVTPESVTENTDDGGKRREATMLKRGMLTDISHVEMEY
jgi:hypothetical protein